MAEKQTKFIFVTGGVVSGLGKGITAASLGRLLKTRGLKVASQKLDPYINVDPGTMSPLQHGEVFVTDDGTETDLDLGHYERFIDENLNKYSNLTTGKVYWNVLNKERQGAYLGQTVQIIPHITNEIKSYIYNLGKSTGADVVITEIGGTTGDIESQPFLEAIRQVGLEQGPENCCYIHVVLVPYISGSDEYKSKPAQHSCKELQGMGISPNVIVLRADGPVGSDIKRKISMFCNVRPDCVIENLTMPSLYECPLMLQPVAGRGRGEEAPAGRSSCRPDRMEGDQPHCHPQQDLHHALVGKYVKLHDAYLSVMESLYHAGFETESKVDIKWVDSETLLDQDRCAEELAEVDGIILPGGFGDRGIEGMIQAARYAREQKIPYFGICLGMQIMVMEYARSVLGYADANSSEFTPDGAHNVIALMPDQQGNIPKGGTMRLGKYPCVIAPAPAWLPAMAGRRSTSVTATATSSTTITAPSLRRRPTIAGTSPTAAWWKPWNRPTGPSHRRAVPPESRAPQPRPSAVQGLYYGRFAVPDRSHPHRPSRDDGGVRTVVLAFFS
ncbi:MAG: CTP synthase [Blautia massiliensis (ex Durand et al. 2017)]